MDMSGSATDLSMSAAGKGWRAAAAVPEARTEVAAALVRGKIYLLGGLAQSGGTTCVDVYDPQLDRWADGPALPAGAPRHHLAVAVHADRIFVVGGYLGDTFIATAKTWVLEGGAWRAAAEQPLARGAATAQTFGDRILVAGGAAMDKVYGDLYAYDAANDRWITPALSPMEVPREHIASCAIGKKMIVSAGRVNGGNIRAAESYDTEANRWTRLQDQPTARSGLAAAPLGDVCYTFGGERLDGQPPGTFNESEGFDVARGAWMTYAPMPTRRHGLAAVAHGGSIYVLGGGPQPGFTYSTVVEVFTP